MFAATGIRQSLTPPSIVLKVVACLFAAIPAQAGDFACSGTAPDWVVDLRSNTARLVLGTETTMDIMLETLAEGQDWPRAYTLIGDRDTAILLIEREPCGPADNTRPYRAHLMTQRGQQPILLGGCCIVGQP